MGGLSTASTKSEKRISASCGLTNTRPRGDGTTASPRPSGVSATCTSLSPSVLLRYSCVHLLSAGQSAVQPSMMTGRLAAMRAWNSAGVGGPAIRGTRPSVQYLRASTQGDASASSARSSSSCAVSITGDSFHFQPASVFLGRDCTFFARDANLLGSSTLRATVSHRRTADSSRVATANTAGGAENRSWYCGGDGALCVSARHECCHRGRAGARPPTRTELRPSAAGPV